MREISLSAVKVTWVLSRPVLLRLELPSWALEAEFAALDMASNTFDKKGCTLVGSSCTSADKSASVAQQAMLQTCQFSPVLRLRQDLQELVIGQEIETCEAIPRV